MLFLGWRSDDREETGRKNRTLRTIRHAGGRYYAHPELRQAALTSLTQREDQRQNSAFVIEIAFLMIVAAFTI